tara:strand:+ start:568 stop:738 length:171 start_codon:yes stop_codon:yes gene_type:complete
MKSLNDEYSQVHLEAYNEILGFLFKYRELIYEYDRAGDRINKLKDEICSLKKSLGQ